jgi:Xaa-Pro aminopeptidase
MKNVYSIVKNAHELAISKIKLGIECKELDRVVREKITNSGYKFRHSTGHGIGLRIHEFPKIGPKSNHILQKNMAFTIEPGIYLKNEFGVRIEDCFVMKNRALKISKLEIPTYD